MTSTIFDKIRNRAEGMLSKLNMEVQIRGLWMVKYCNQVGPDERMFSGYMVIAQSIGQGTCLIDDEPNIDFRIVTKSVRDFIKSQDAVSIALLDSIYNGLSSRPRDSLILTGDPATKASERADLIAREASSLVTEVRHRKQALLIGFVAHIAKALQRFGFDVTATDLDQSEIGKQYEGVVVESASKNETYIVNSDIVVVSGTTLHNQTLDAILDLAKRASTRVVVFAQTGASLAGEYLDFGADVVVAEPFPKYDFHGSSEIWIHRRST